MSNNSFKPTVVVTNLSNRIQYYQWFVYGLQLLAKKGEIKLEFKVPFMQRFLLYNNKFLVKCVNKIQYLKGGQAEEKAKAYFTGYIKHGTKQKCFCIDSADSPNKIGRAHV